MLLHVVIAADDSAIQKKLRRSFARSGAVLDVVKTEKQLWDKIHYKTCDVAVIAGGLAHSLDTADTNKIQRLVGSPTVVVVLEKVTPTERATFITAGCGNVLDLESPPEKLREAFKVILDRRRQSALTDLAAQERLPEPTLENSFVAQSAAMNQLLRAAQRVINSDSVVLVLGETGVGKERLARTIHSEGSRRSEPFISINCGALPETLLESELFGHEEGAFTGAIRARRGCFEMAHRGTLFLDEIGELPTHLQVKLLHVLENDRIQRVGGEKPIPIDVRIMAATNRDLEEDIRTRRFRKDLYYRLNVFSLTIPPLRRRREDIPELVQCYLDFLSTRIGNRVSGITDEAMDMLCQYSWPGNVRELINLIERAMLLAVGDVITKDDLPGLVDEQRTLAAAFLSSGDSQKNPPGSSQNWLEMPLKEVNQKVLEQTEHTYISNLLRSTNGRMGMAAKKAGIDQRSLFEKMRKYKLRKEDFRQKV